MTVQALDAPDDWKPLARLPQKRARPAPRPSAGPPVLTVSSSTAGPAQPDRKLVRGYLTVTAVTLLADPAYVLIEQKGRSIRLTGLAEKCDGSLKLIGRPNGRYLTGSQLRRLLGRNDETVKVELRQDGTRLIGNVPTTVPLRQIAEGEE